MSKAKSVGKRKDPVLAKAHTQARKAKKLARRWRHYKIQPPKALAGLSEELRSLVEKELAKAKG